MNLETLKNRELISASSSRAVTDGDGVKINRNVEPSNLHAYDPFLMLDELSSEDVEDYIGGFPEHPHRGIETVTYMLEGQMKHRDHMGNEGLLEAGSVQWMTAGRGVLHSEMPQQESGKLHGFQLWVNLPAKYKMIDPQYRMYSLDQIPVLKLSERSKMYVIAGVMTLDSDSVAGPISEVSTNPDFFDIILGAGESVTIPIDKNKKVILYNYQGLIDVIGNNETNQLTERNLGLLSNGERIEIKAKMDSRFLLIAGEPINEPIAKWGPFVMNTDAEIKQAIEDFNSGRLV